jgi:hypothetical protein
MPDEDEIYFLDGEALERVLAASPNGGLCSKIKVLAHQGRLRSCRSCFKVVLDANPSPVAVEITGWGIGLIDDGELIDIECGRLISNLNPAFLRRPETYRQKLTVIAKSRLGGCVLVTDDTALSSSSMVSICDKMQLSYETFDDLFGNLQ